MKRSSGPVRALAMGVVAVLAICAATSCDGDDSPATTPATDADAAVSTESTTTDTLAEPITTDTLAEPITTSAATADACADREALRASVVALGAVDIVAEGTNGIAEALEQIQDDLDNVRASAGTVVEPEIRAVQDAIGATQEGLQELGDGGAAELATALSALSTATTTLMTTLAGGPPCD